MFMFNDDHLNYSEKTSSLTQIDSLIPYQWSETVERKLHLQAEKRLMLAILEDAIFCFQRYLGARRRKEQRLFEETETWIMESESDWIFSFESVCQSLKLDPGYVRRGLLDWKHKMTGSSPVDPGRTRGGKNKSSKTRLRFAA